MNCEKTTFKGGGNVLAEFTCGKCGPCTEKKMSEELEGTPVPEKPVEEGEIPLNTAAFIDTLLADYPFRGTEHQLLIGVKTQIRSLEEKVDYFKGECVWLGSYAYKNHLRAEKAQKERDDLQVQLARVVEKSKAVLDYEKLHETGGHPWAALAEALSSIIPETGKVRGAKVNWNPTPYSPN